MHANSANTHRKENKQKCLIQQHLRRSLPNIAVNKLFRLVYEKSVGVHTVTRPTLRGLRIAQFSRTSNAEAHADMYTKPLVYPIKQGIPLARCYTPMDIYCCLIPD